MLRTVIATAGAAGLLTLTACGGGGSGAAAGSSPSAPSKTVAGTAADLATWQSPLGTVVVTGAGRAVYAFDKDTPGSAASACTGGCASLWPAVTTTADAPSVRGLTGTVGTLPAAGGGTQVTLDGHRLYTYAGDTGSGQTTGQGFGGLWWVVAPNGAPITKAAASPAAPSSSPAAPSSSGIGGYSY